MNREKKMYGTMNYLIYIYIYIYISTPHRRSWYKQKSNVNLICEGVKLKSKS